MKWISSCIAIDGVRAKEKKKEKKKKRIPISCSAGGLLLRIHTR